MSDPHQNPGELEALRRVCRALARDPGQVPGAAAALGQHGLHRLADPVAWRRVDAGNIPDAYLFAPIDTEHLLTARVRLSGGGIAEIGFDDLPGAAADRPTPTRPAAGPNPAPGRCPNATLAAALGAVADVLQTGDPEAIGALRAALDDRDTWSRMPAARDPGF